jgi:3-oxoadipate enol-lactonase
MTDAPTRFVPVSGGVQLATFERGRGRPIVMINGLGASAHDWGPTVEQLATRARVITFDNRGAGASTAPADPFTLEQLADDTAAVFAAYGLTSAYLVGYSMGGMIAQILAATRPELVERLVLMATHMNSKTAIPSTLQVQAAMFPKETLSREELVRGMYSVFVTPEFLARQRDTFERMLAVRMANLIPRLAWQLQLQAIVQSDRTGRVRAIRAPTLIIHGRDDPLIRFGEGEKLRDLIPGAQFVALDGCGHMVNWEKPTEVVAAISELFDL